MRSRRSSADWPAQPATHGSRCQSVKFRAAPHSSGCRDTHPFVGTVRDWKPDGSCVQHPIVDSTPPRPVSPTLANVVCTARSTVYDLRTLADGGPPKHSRIEYVDEPHCVSGDGIFGTLDVRDDELIYVPKVVVNPHLSRLRPSRAGRPRERSPLGPSHQTGFR